MARKAAVKRKTKETEISLGLNLDGSGKASVSTGLKFFDHMLETLARHALFDLSVKAAGDIDVDEHHLVEDVAICLGKAVADALGDKRGMRRFGDAIVPMDDALARVGLDLSGRAYLVYSVDFKRAKIGDVREENFEHFFDSFAKNAGANLNICAEGKNDHHKIEAVFKAVAKSLREAVERDPRVGIASTKEKLE